jgi:DNA-directed RNA polymerase subunit A"
MIKCKKVLNLKEQTNNYESIDRRILQKYIEIFEEQKNSKLIVEELNILKQAVNSNVIWDEIINIEVYTPDQTEYVYDFTVPDNQTFMIDNGIIVHNTLNTKHSAGVASKSNVTGGVPRIE